jgi:hypothetical protein
MKGEIGGKVMKHVIGTQKTRKSRSSKTVDKDEL